MIKSKFVKISNIIRWGFVFIAGALFLTGIFYGNFYRAFAYTSLNPQDEKEIHPYRPDLVKPLPAFANPHPPFKPKMSLTALQPAASGSSSIVECQSCHVFHSAIIDQGFSAVQIEGYERLFLDCAACHLSPEIFVVVPGPL
jgi:hypothetical protein